MSDSMAIAYRMKRRKMAQGGVVDEEKDPSGDDDLVKRIMMARGGMVSDDVGEDINPVESIEDQPSSEPVEHDADIVSRIMQSRSKKDRLPRQE